MIVTITGTNDYARRQMLAEKITAFIAEHGDMAVERFDGEEATADRMREALQSLPFLSPRKLVVLREPGKQKAFAEAIADVLQDVADSTDAIFYEPKLDKRGSYYKTLKKLTDFQEQNTLDVAALSRWAVTYAKEQGASLSGNDALFLIDRLGANQQLLQSELHKLLLYDQHITRQTISLLTEPLPQSTVFELLDAAFGGKTQRAFALYEEQRALKVEPQAILALLTWQLHVLAVVKAAANRSIETIAQTAKLNSFVVRKSYALTRQLSLERIKQLISELLQLDMQLKHTAIDADEALRLYLLKIAA